MADSSKTENATPQHRQKARKRGQITRSRELTGALTLFAVVGAVGGMAKVGAGQWAEFFRETLDSANTEAISPAGPILFWTGIEALRWVAPIMACALLVSIVGGFAQGGFVLAPESLAFNAQRISPAAKFKQMFSWAGLSQVLKSIIPFAAIGWIGFACIESHWVQILTSCYGNPKVFVSLVGSMLFEVSLKSGIVMLAWAGFDYLLLWLKSEGDLKMSRQEIKEEMKDTDGNPQNKARIRRIQRQTRRKQMMKATETATVVVTNPTHYAVALRFEATMAAPVVVAKGLDLLAAKIKEIARDREIPIMENRPLAQALYKSVEVGDVIPSALYHAVAEILVMVFRAQEEVKRRDAQRKASTKSSNETRPW